MGNPGGSKETNKGGRPSKRPQPLDHGIVDIICERLIGGESMTQICADERMPHKSQVYLAMAKDEAFRTAIAHAREAQQEAEIDRTVDLADSATSENWQVVKLQINTRQWRAAKLAPKKYGDKVTQEVTGPNGGPLIQHNVNMTADEFAQIAKSVAEEV